MIEIKEIVTQARTWVGTPFCHQARVKNKGCDCLGLIVGVAAELGLQDKAGHPLAAGDEIAYSKQPDSRRMMERLSALLEEGSLDAIQPGDIGLFEVGGNPQHLAIFSDYEGGLGMIHCYAQARRVVEHRLDREWRNRLVKVFRWLP